MNSSTARLTVYETETDLQAHPAVAPNSNENACLRDGLIKYPIFEPFTEVFLVGFTKELSLEEGKVLKAILAPQNSKLFIKGNEDEAFLKATKTALLLSGFLLSNASGDQVVICASPRDFANGASVSLKRLSGNDWKTVLTTTNNASDVELVNEDDLITEEDQIRPDKVMDCGPDAKGARKACKNCSCGLAEMNAEDMKQSKETPKSSCGSCYLGDAFRCSRCPYRGLPAFKPGEQVSIPTDFLQDDL